jgi:hypothetical protein
MDTETFHSDQASIKTGYTKDVRISKPTLNRAKEALGVRSFQRKRQWFNELPERPSDEPDATELKAKVTRLVAAKKSQADGK